MSLVVFFLLSLISLGYSQSTNTYKVKNDGRVAYIFQGPGVIGSNPPLNLLRGTIAIFNVSADGHPFWINTLQGTGTDNGYSSVKGQGAEIGQVVLTIPSDAPDQLYYNCEYHAKMTGVINII